MFNQTFLAYFGLTFGLIEMLFLAVVVIYLARYAARRAGRLA